jgi:hypothetical protein
MMSVFSSSASPALSSAWLDANQRHLGAALARVRAALHGYATAQAGTWRPESAELPAYAPGAAVDGTPMALDRLVSLAGLSAFERDLLLLVAGVELDSSIAALCASAHRDAQRPFATFSLALAALPGAHWSALSPGAALRHWKMIDTGPAHVLTTSALRIDERILHYLTGVAAPDQRLAGLVWPATSGATELAASHVDVVEHIVGIWRRSMGWRNPPIIQLRGDGVAIKQAIAAAACEAVGMMLSVAPVESIPLAPQDAESFGRLWEREAALTGAGRLIEAQEHDPREYAPT